MLPQKADSDSDEGALLNLFFSEEGEAWRAHVRPAWLPRYLRPFFDVHGEAYPVLLDLDDLDAHMRTHGASYEKRVAVTGGVELTARGAAASELAVWLSTALASGVRPRQP
jgi:hypothetical protein